MWQVAIHPCREIRQAGYSTVGRRRRRTSIGTPPAARKGDGKAPICLRIRLSRRARKGGYAFEHFICRHILGRCQGLVGFDAVRRRGTAEAMSALRWGVPTGGCGADDLGTRASNAPISGDFCHRRYTPGRHRRYPTVPVSIRRLWKNDHRIATSGRPRSSLFVDDHRPGACDVDRSRHTMCLPYHSRQTVSLSVDRSPHFMAVLAPDVSLG